MRQGCLAGHYSINHSRLSTAPMRAAISQSVFVELEVPMEKTIITVGDLTDTERKRVLYESYVSFGWRRYFAMVAIQIKTISAMPNLQSLYQRTQIEEIAFWRLKAFQESLLALAVFLCLYVFDDEPQQARLQANLGDS